MVAVVKGKAVEDSRDARQEVLLPGYRDAQSGNWGASVAWGSRLLPVCRQTGKWLGFWPQGVGV